MKTKAKSISGATYPQSRIRGVADLFEFIKEPDWHPDTVDVALVRQLCIGPNYESKVIQAARFLGLINIDGRPTSEFDELKRDYKSTLTRLITEKYSPLFKTLPPKMANQDRLVAFFGQPIESAEYKAKLFVWFCDEAGIELPDVNRNFRRARFEKLKETDDEEAEG